MTFLCYASLTKNISAHITNINCKMKNKICPILPFQIALLSQRSKTSRIVYESLVNALRKKKSGENSKLEQKWTRDVGMINHSTMHDVLASTKNTYLQSLHYRITNRIIATNTFLQRIGIADDARCTFCMNNDETLKHMLWDCAIVQNFISETKTYLREEFRVEICIDTANFFFPTIEKLSKIQILIITLFKYTITTAKYKSQAPSKQLFISLLKSEAMKEKGAALKRQAMGEVIEKWGTLLNILG